MNLSCPHCSAGADTLCPACGRVHQTAGEESIECANHASEDAVALCLVCGKPVCGDCATTVQERYLCDDPDHRSVLSEWAVVFVAASVFEAEMVCRNLEQAGFEVRFYDRQAAALLWQYPALRAEVRTRKEAAAESVHLLRELQLLEDTDDEKGQHHG